MCPIQALILSKMLRAMPKRLDVNAPYWVQMRLAERGIIEYAYQEGGSIWRTAALLGISVPHLRRRMTALGLSADKALKKTSKKSRKVVNKKSSSKPRRKKAAPQLSAKPAEQEIAHEQTSAAPPESAVEPGVSHLADDEFAWDGEEDAFEDEDEDESKSRADDPQTN